MTSVDFWAGRRASNMAHSAALQEADSAIGDWQRFSSGLQGKLEQSNNAFAKAEAGRRGFAKLFKALSDELRRVDPNNPLLDRNVQLKMLSAEVSQQAAAMGYQYDPASGELFKR